jgi:hypothetical protein
MCEVKGIETLDAHKGRDFDAEKQKKLIKAAEKKKAKKATVTVWASRAWSNLLRFTIVGLY